MNMKKWTKKVAGASLAGVVLTGAGMTAAVAAPQTVSPPAGAYTMSQVTNLTPFTWTFQVDPGPGWNSYDVAPPQTVLPGQTASWAAHDVNDHWRCFNYVFNDWMGGGHTVQLEDESYGGNGEAQYLSSKSKDGTGDNAVNSTANFHMAQDADGLKRHVDAIWTQSYSVTLDAASDPTAASIVNSELPRASAVSWNPDSKTPTFTNVDAQQASSTLQNDSSADARIEVSQETEVGERTKIGEETTASVSANVFGFAAKAAASVTSDKEWTDSNKVKISESAPVRSGYTGYLVKKTSIATLPGTLKFTTPEGAEFTIKNVAISRDDIINPDGSMPTGVTVSATEFKTGDAGSGPAATR